MNDLSSSPRSEARGAKTEARSLLPLLVAGMTAEEIRGDILGDSCDPEMRAYRAAVRAEFDRLVLRLNPAALSRGRIQFLHPVHPIELTATLEAEILRRLLGNQTTEQVARDLRIPICPVRKVSRAHRVSFRKTGYGRRYSAATIKAMAAELRTGARPTDIAKRYGCTLELTKRIRNQFGDTLLDRRDLRRVKPKTAAAVRKALAAEQSLIEIERAFRLTHSWLWHFRKHILRDSEDRRRRKLVIPAAERVQIIAELRASKSIRAVARQFHHAYGVIKAIGFAAGWTPRKCRKFTAHERGQILKLIAAGKSNREIAKELHCSTTVIQQARRKSRWTTQAKAA